MLDPSRTETDEDGKVKAFDVHSKINLDLGGNTIPWKVLGAKVRNCEERIDNAGNELN